MADIDRSGDKISTVLSYEKEPVVTLQFDDLERLAGTAGT
jgi:hypothetical protein